MNLVLIFFTNEPQIIDPYQVGVDECICKLVSPAILLAKVKTWLSCSWAVPAEGLDVLHVRDICLDPRQQVVIGDGQPIELTNLEFQLLHVLMNHPGWVMFTSTYFLFFTLLRSVLPGGETLFNNFVSALHGGATFNDVHLEGFHIYG